MHETRCDAVVVGGGFAGVTAARELTSRGLRTVLVEARDRLGGRTWTTDFGGTLVELGGAWVHWHQPYVWSELTRYGIGILEDDWQFDTTLFGAAPRRYPPEESFARVRDLFARYAGHAQDRIPHPHDPLRLKEKLAELDALSMQDRLDELQLDETDEKWLTGLLYEIAGSPLDDAGLITVLRWMALCDWNIDGWYDTNKYRPVGGTATLIDAMSQDPRLDVRLSSPVQRVEASSYSVSVVTAAGDRVHATTAVLAVPVNLWPHIEFDPGLPTGHLEAARRGVGKPHMDKVWIRVRGDIGRIFAQLPAPAPLNFFWTYERWDDGQLIIGINANPELDVTDATQVADTIRAYVPEIEEVTGVLGQRWSAEEYSRGGNTCYRPGQLTRHLADLQQTWGPVAFAGTDLANGWAGYIDGAIESGTRAAREAHAIYLQH